MDHAPMEPPRLEPAGCWSFADAVLDESGRRLSVRGQPVAIDRKPFDVLVHLLRHAGTVVTKDDLARACWPGRLLSDSVLSRTLSRVREALGDRDQRVVETVHGVGWRLAAAAHRATRSAPPRPGNLPAPPAPLIGRDGPLRQAATLLRREGVRLLTLTGCGGIGKTRLGIAVANQIASDFADGVWFVDLAPVTRIEQFAGALAQAFGIRESGIQPMLETLAEQLRGRELMLLLDNCEQIIAAAPQLAALLAAGPRLRVLATSREPLHIRGEHLMEVPALAVPAEESTAPPEQVGDFAAVELFVERARMALADFALSAVNADAVCRVCRQLDGVPLAIELAAARSRLLSPEALLRGLADRFAMLRDGARDLPPRQQALWATVDWSYQLLEGNERAVLRHASVFAGGFTLEAAKTVAASGEVAAADVFHLLARLVDKSLVHYEDQGVPGRYRLLETIRDYAARRLQENAGEAAAARARHLHWCIERVEASAAHLWLFLPEAAMREWTARVDADLENLRAALAWSVQDPSATVGGLRLMAASHWYWFERGYIAEARQWLAQLFDRAGGVPAPVHAQALVAAANLAIEQGGGEATRTASLAYAREALERSLVAFRALGEKSWIAFVHSSIAAVAVTGSGDAAEAERHVQAGLALAREANDRWMIAYLTHFAGRGAYFAGDLDAAASAFEESVSMARAIGGHSVGEGYGVYWLGRIARARGDRAGATALQREALALFGAAGNVQGLAMVLTALGVLAESAGDAYRGALLLGAVAAWRANKRIFLEPDVGQELERHLARARETLGAVQAAATEALAAGIEDDAAIAAARAAGA